MSETNYYSEEIISGIKIAVLVSSKGIKKIFLNPVKEIIEFSSATKLRSDDPYLFGIFNQLKEYFAGTRKEFDVPLDLDVPQQADDRRQLEAEGNGPDFPVVHRDNLDLPLAPKRDRFLPVDDLERLVRRVQQQRLFHELFEFCPSHCRGVKASRL